MAKLYKRGRVWYSKIEVFGKKYRKALSSDRRIAEEMLSRIVLERGAQKHSHAQRDNNYLYFKEKYLVWSKSEKRPATTTRNIESFKALESFRCPRMLSELTPQFLEEFKMWRKQKGKGNATINRDLTSVKAFLYKAVAWGCLSSFNGRSVGKLRETRSKLIFYTPNELSEIYRRCITDHPWKSHKEKPYDWLTVAMLGSRAGLRLSEIHFLSWADIDFDRCTLSVTAKDGWNPKDYEERHVPMPHDLKKRLESLSRASAWVLGDRPSLGVMSAFFRRIVGECGLKGSLHTLRHTYASHLAQAGVSLYAIQKLLGHASPEMTQRYAHLCPDSMADVVTKLPCVRFVPTTGIE